MHIGILALQGDFAAHAKKIEELEQKWRLVKQPHDLDNIDGLIMPGGESGALLKLMAPFNFDAALIEFAGSGRPIFGTCAGMILLAKHVVPQQRSLGLIDITVERNAYGRQLESFVASGEIVGKELNAVAVRQQHPSTIELVFIRAPQIKSVDNKEVEVLVAHQGLPMMVQQRNILVASFHPELTKDSLIYDYFLALC
jgi:pyridoxal 5'-phosphate synthase pdxT subunit